MTEFVKPWIRVKDKRTKHQYDVLRDLFDPEKHELVERAGDSWKARPAKPHVDLRKTSGSKPDEGGSPDTPSSKS